MTTPRIEEMARDFCKNTPRIREESGVSFYERLVEALTQAHQAGIEEAVKEINKKYWLNPKRSKKDIAKDNAWNDLGNTLRNGV